MVLVNLLILLQILNEFKADHSRRGRPKKAWPAGSKDFGPCEVSGAHTIPDAIRHLPVIANSKSFIQASNSIEAWLNPFSKFLIFGAKLINQIAEVVVLDEQLF